jgi:nucleotide-binding universal stress UspA family protein
MKTFTHILCPIDFSVSSNRSLGMAEQLAKDLETELTVIHVVDTRLPSLGHLYPLENILQESRRRAELEMAAKKKESTKLSRARWEVVEGIPHRAIVEYSRKGGIDLVVMGGHGYTGVERLLLGSVTEKVLHQIEIPILVVGTPAGGADEPFVAKPLRTILVAVDLGPGSDLAIEYASALAKRYGSKLLAVHVVSPLADVLGGPLWPAAPELTRLSGELRTKRTEEMQKLVNASSLEGVETETLISEGEPPESILGLAADRHVDLLVMGAHGHRTEFGWLGSTCHRVTRACPCPVLAVRRPKS